MSRRKYKIKRSPITYFVAFNGHVWHSEEKRWMQLAEEHYPRPPHHRLRQFKTMRAAERAIRAILAQHKDSHKQIFLDRVGRRWEARSWSITKD